MPKIDVNDLKLPSKKALTPTFSMPASLYDAPCAPTEPLVGSALVPPHTHSVPPQAQAELRLLPFHQALTLSPTITPPSTVAS